MDLQKPECSYGVSCYRKNPLHFEQLSHPQLEKLLDKISGTEIILPDNLEFECGNRALLRKQLEMLRTIKQNPSGRESLALKRKASGSEHSDALGDGKRQKDETQETSDAKPAAPLYAAPKGEFSSKWTLAAPYHIFFTVVPKTPATWTQNLSVSFSEILDKSLGDIAQSLHLNMVVDFQWLVEQYILAGQGQWPKMTVFYDQSPPDKSGVPKDCKAYIIKCETQYGIHHCKISIFQYRDSGIRIVVSSANLYRPDWEFRTQGLWISPHLPQMSDSAKETEGESPTGFKRDFLHFLGQYDDRMNDWKAIVSRADCSSINVAFVGAVPGKFKIDDTRWGHQKLGVLLENHAKVPDNETRTAVVAQASSIGTLGKKFDSWIGTEILASMAKTQGPNENVPDFKFIFPTVENFKNSHDFNERTNCLCNGQQKKQEWILPYMHEWKAEQLSRTLAIPHIKTFTRISEDNKRIWWFVLGSANLSKIGWGQHYQRKYRILNYEAGVVFIPKFVTGEEDFSICEDSKRSSPTFPMPYDLPLTPYAPTDKPFINSVFRDSGI